MRTFGAVAASLFLAATPAWAQPTDLIGDELDVVRGAFFQLGPFYATPVIRFASGYDSNALSTPEAQGDIRAVIGPGVHVGLPFGSQAFVTVFQEVDFVYYREQVDLRQVFGTTRVRGGFGTRRILLTLRGDFRDEIQRPSSEFDFPVEQRTKNLDAAVTLALGSRQRLRVGYVRRVSEIREGFAADPTITERLNNRQDTALVTLLRDVTSKTQAIAQFDYQRQRFDDTTRSGESYSALFGLDFSPRVGGLLVPSSSDSGMSGRLLVGFENLTPFEERRVDYTGLIATADVSYTSTSQHRLRGLARRDVAPSIFDDNWYFIENRAGAFFRWQVHSRVSVEPGVVFGQNDYPLPRLIEGGGAEAPRLEDIVDEHVSYQLTVEYRLRPSWFVGVTTEYLERRSNVRSFDKERLLVSFTVSLRP